MSLPALELSAHSVTQSSWSTLWRCRARHAVSTSAAVALLADVEADELCAKREAKLLLTCVVTGTGNAIVLTGSGETLTAGGDSRPKCAEYNYRPSATWISTGDAS
jgi:hypothetical protein